MKKIFLGFLSFCALSVYGNCDDSKIKTLPDGKLMDNDGYVYNKLNKIPSCVEIINNTNISGENKIISKITNHITTKLACVNNEAMYVYEYNGYSTISYLTSRCICKNGAVYLSEYVE